MYGAFSKPTSRRIIDALLAGRKSLSELAEALELTKPTLQQKHLKPLEELGIVTKKLEKNPKGQEAYYTLQRFLQLRSIDPESGSAVTAVSTAVFAQSHLLLVQLEESEFKADLKLLLEQLEKSWSKADLKQLLDQLEKRESNADLKLLLGNVARTLGEAERLEFIILFGSVARGEGTWKSDIDIALLKLTWDTAMINRYTDLISRVTMETHHQIKPHFLTLLEFEGGDSLLIQEMKQSGIVIYGDRFGRPSLWRSMKRYKSITL